MIIACLITTLSCSSVQTHEITNRQADENADLAPPSADSSSNIHSTISSSPTSTIKPAANRFPNANITPLPDKPAAAGLSTEAGEFSYKRGYEHYRNRDYDLAFNELTKAIHLDANLAVAYWVRGLSYSGKDLHQQAIDDYDVAIKLNPKEPKLYRNRGMVYHKLNLEHLALRDFTEAIEIAPTFVAVYRNRAHIYVTVGEFRKALVDLDSAVLLNPGQANLYKDRSDVYKQLGQDKQAQSDNFKACSLENHYC